MKNFIISDNLMESAKSYMPLREKKDLAKQIADLCLVPMKTAEQNRAGEKLLAMPNMRSEDMALKQILLLNTLLGFYFDIKVDPEKDSYEQYDFYSGAHIFNQLERYKGTMWKNKAFDILSDFKEFRKMVDTEIFNIRQNWNDPVARFTSAVQILSTPENVKALMDELKSTSEEYTEALHKQKLMMSGEGENA